MNHPSNNPMPMKKVCLTPLDVPPVLCYSSPTFGFKLGFLYLHLVSWRLDGWKLDADPFAPGARLLASRTLALAKEGGRRINFLAIGHCVVETMPTSFLRWEFSWRATPHIHVARCSILRRFSKMCQASSAIVHWRFRPAADPSQAKRNKRAF